MAVEESAIGPQSGQLTRRYPVAMKNYQKKPSIQDDYAKTYHEEHKIPLRSHSCDNIREFVVGHGGEFIVVRECR